MRTHVRISKRCIKRWACIEALAKRFKLLIGPGVSLETVVVVRSIFFSFSSFLKIIIVIIVFVSTWWTAVLWRAAICIHRSPQFPPTAACAPQVGFMTRSLSLNKKRSRSQSDLESGWDELLHGHLRSTRWIVTPCWQEINLTSALRPGRAMIHFRNIWQWQGYFLFSRKSCFSLYWDWFSCKVTRLDNVTN